MIRGHVEVYSDSNLNEGNLIFSEKNLVVDGMGELISTMMTLSPDASTTQSSSLYDASNYTIHAISFGKAGSEYFYNAHANFGPTLYGRELSGQVWVSATTSSYVPNLYVPKPASPTDNKIVSFENAEVPENALTYTYTSAMTDFSGFLNIWNRDGIPIAWNDSSQAGFSGLPSNINELRFKDVQLNKSGLLTLSLDGYVSSFRSNSNTVLGPNEFQFNPIALGGGCLQIYVNRHTTTDKRFFAITSAGNVSSWNGNDTTEGSNDISYFKNPIPTHPVKSISIAENPRNGIALYQDGTVSSWNRYPNPQTSSVYGIGNPPSSIQGQVRKIGSTTDYHIALLNDNSVCAWGSPYITSTTELSSLYIYESSSADPKDINFINTGSINNTKTMGTIVDENGGVKIFGVSTLDNQSGWNPDLANTISNLTNVSSISSNARSTIVLFKNGYVSAYGGGAGTPFGTTPWNTRFASELSFLQGQFSKIKIAPNYFNGFISYTTTGGVFSGTSFGVLNDQQFSSSLESDIPALAAAVAGRVREWHITDGGPTGFIVLTDNTVSSWGSNGQYNGLPLGLKYIPPGIQGITSSIIVTNRDRLALLTNGQVSAWVPSGNAVNKYVSYISSIPTSVNTGTLGRATHIGLASYNMSPLNFNSINELTHAIRAFAIIKSPNRQLISWGIGQNIPAFDSNFANTYFSNKITNIYSGGDARYILFLSKKIPSNNLSEAYDASVLRYPSIYYNNAALSADLSSTGDYSLPSSLEPSRKKITSAIDFATGSVHALFLGSEGYVSSWYPLSNVLQSILPYLRYANKDVKNKIWKSVACGPYFNYAISSSSHIQKWGKPSVESFPVIPTPNNDNPRYDKLNIGQNTLYNALGLYSADVVLNISDLLPAGTSLLNNVNFKQNVNLLPFIGKTINKIPTPQGQLPVVVSAVNSLLEGCYAPSGGQIVSLVSEVFPYTLITSASLSGTFNTLGNMDHRGYINKTSTGNPASGLVVSSTNSLSSTGEIMCIIKIHKDDCAFTNLFGGITQLGIWGYDIKKNIENGKYPPYSFSRFPEQTGTYVTPNEYKLLAKKVFHDNILKVSDNGTNAGLKNHADLTIVWKLYFV